MKDIITSCISESIKTKNLLLQDEYISQIIHIADELKKTVARGGTIYACGNGGSACDAMHFTEELVARFKRERPGIRAMHFQDTGAITCWGNDYSFEDIFTRQVETFCTQRDMLFLLSTSGNSKNILNAAQAAKNIGIFTVGLAGKDGGVLKTIVPETIVVPSSETERIQEAHIMIIHILCELVER